MQRHASQQAEYGALLTALEAVKTASSDLNGYYLPPPGGLSPGH